MTQPTKEEYRKEYETLHKPLEAMEKVRLMYELGMLSHAAPLKTE